MLMSQKRILHNAFPSSTRIKVSDKAQKQRGKNDCIMFALAFAISLAFVMDQVLDLTGQIQT